jgi:hypothetical protein
MKGCFYTCDCCGKEWRKVSLYGDGEPKVTKGNLTFIYGAISTAEENYTLTENGRDFHLCADCTKKLYKALYDVGFNGLYQGALMETKLENLIK